MQQASRIDATVRDRQLQTVRYDSKLWIRDLMEGAAYLPE
jgi:hypothetical protein